MAREAATGHTDDRGASDHCLRLDSLHPNPTRKPLLDGSDAESSETSLRWVRTATWVAAAKIPAPFMECRDLACACSVPSQSTLAKNALVLSR